MNSLNYDFFIETALNADIKTFDKLKEIKNINSKHFDIFINCCKKRGLKEFSEINNCSIRIKSAVLSDFSYELSKIT